MANLRLGGHVDPGSHQRLDTSAAVPSEELTTHAVIVGMTGSGKTGLGVVLIEEALAAGVPTLLIDPKGDLTNLALTFPDLTPTQFQPWVNESDAAKAGQSVPEFAAAQAELWKKGLATWALGPPQVKALHEAADVTIYTPGANHGVRLNAIGTLDAPPDLSEAQAVQEEIDAYVGSLLNLLGIESDPLSSREHILLSNLINDAWTQGRSLDLAALVAAVQTPPIRKIGVLELDSYYPPADRQKLALKLNGLLASPAFAAWLGGQRIDIEAMLRSPDGRPRCAVVSIAHLSDEQRQSVTSVLLAKLISWMRRQSGTSDLRALLYMDEVAGYLPPLGAPPTKAPIMLLLKQARAFGVSVVLSTQNPVDLDYKALGNAGTWLIGRLQTEQDKARLVSGLSSAAGTIDPAAVSATISGLAKREFVLKRASKDVVEVLTTRWAMSYLRGPLTRDQVAGLMAGRAETPAAPSQADQLGKKTATGAEPAPIGEAESAVMPQVAAGIEVSYLDPAARWAAMVRAVPGFRLAPAVVARVSLRFDDRKAGILADEEYETVLYPIPESPAAGDFQPVDYDDRDLLTNPPAGAIYQFPPNSVKTKTWWTALQRDLTDHLVRTREKEVPVNLSLKLYGRVGESTAEFDSRAAAAAADRADAEIATLQTKYERKIEALQRRIDTAEAGVARQKSARTATVTQDALGGLLGGLFGGRRGGSVVTSMRRAGAAQNRVDAAQDKLAELQQGLAALADELTDESAEIRRKWQDLAAESTTLTITLTKTDVRVTDIGLVWVPIA